MAELNEESPERLARPLIRLAQSLGVATSYVGMSRDFHEIPDDVLVAVLKALNVDASSEETIEVSLEHVNNQRAMRLIEPTVLHIVGEQSHVPIHLAITEAPKVTITLEDGTIYQHDIAVEPLPDVKVHEVNGKFFSTAQIALPADLPEGYHTLHIAAGQREADATLISAPQRIPLLDPLKNGSLWGWMAQLYSIRSADSWGVGDFADLRTLLIDSKRYTNADFMLINPVHAGEPVSPLTPSPYLPVSRRFINYTYIHPEDIPEYYALDDAAKQSVKDAHAKMEAYNADPNLIDRDAMWLEKEKALRTIFNTGLQSVRQQAFDDYKARCGEDLEAYATWCVCYAKWGKPENTPDNWINKYTKDSPEVKQLREQNSDLLEFYRWLEWIAVEQMHAAQQAARQAGMKIGIMSDMAVGVHPDGSEVWWNPERFANGATVGAPPDMFNQQGQNWSQPPLSPLSLKETGYKAYREMVRGMFDCAGAVRIDHILGLFRLWWIPEGQPASTGTYVYYDHNTMLGILAIEADRVGGLIVGEDLGVVPSYVQQSLADYAIFGCAVEWFEQMDGVFIRPKDWRPYALASVDNHDMPPAAGYLEYEHVRVREQLGLLGEDSSAFERSARAEHQAMLQMLVDNGYLDVNVMKDESGRWEEIVEALYRALNSSPCKLKAVSFVDAVGERRTQNQPGTDNEYPNWRVPLADYHGDNVPLEHLFDSDLLQRIAKIMNS